MPEARAVIEPFSGICIQGAREQRWASVCQDYVRSWHITTDRVLTADGRYWSNSGHCLALALNGTVATVPRLEPTRPTATLAVHSGIGSDAGISPYQSTRLSR